MTISQVYQRYQIPPNLERHMLQVAAVAEYLREHWQGPRVDWSAIRAATLLHDMANIIKFKRPFLGELEDDVEKWERVQEKFKQTYGSDVHTATLAIIGELQLGTLGNHVLVILHGMKKMFEGDLDISWETRVVEYADCVVTPLGIQGFETRMADLQHRYDKTDELWQHPFRLNAALIQDCVDIDLAELESVDFSTALAELAKTELKGSI